MITARTGRQRLSLLLCGLSVGACAALMMLVVVVYGAPYNPVWWWIMAAILFAALVLPLALVSAIEWVMEGYRSQAGD